MSSSQEGRAVEATARMTLDEMLAKYPKRSVEQAVIHRNYKEGREQTIRKFEEQICRGIHVETCMAGLKGFLENTPPAPPFDPEEPEDLDEDVQWRLRVLKYMDRVGEGSDAGSDERDLKNRNAIVKAYRQQKLKVQDGQITVWFAGHMVMGPLSQRDFDFQDIIDDISKWTEQYGPGRIWVENATLPLAKMQSAAIAPYGQCLQHVVC
ncbi:hypothetical protein DTO027B9_5387 [Paecilomyces variotii]|nr:hypothetical protein DTO027B9_5387 [Paecilomyces variotii]